MNIHVWGCVSLHYVLSLKLAYTLTYLLHSIAVRSTVSKMLGAVSNSDTQPPHMNVHNETAHILSFFLTLHLTTIIKKLKM